MKKLKTCFGEIGISNLIYLSFGCEHDFNIQNSILMISHNFCNCQKLFFKEDHDVVFVVCTIGIIESIFLNLNT